MPVPSAISDLSQTAGSNYPAGSESPTTADDYLRTYASYIAKLRDGQGFTAPVTLASATTTDIGGQVSHFVDISGTTTITSFGTNYNGPRYIRFTGALTLTHNATSLILPTGANITTVAGDSCIAYPNAALNGWTVVAYAGKSGQFATITANGGAINGATIGATTPSTGAFTTLSASGDFSVTGAAVNGYFNSDAGAFRWRTAAGVEKAAIRITGNDLKIEDAGGTERLRIVNGTGVSVTGALSSTGGGTISNASTDAVLKIDRTTTSAGSGWLGSNATYSHVFSNGALTNIGQLKITQDAAASTATINSTGLAVTGALSSTGAISTDSQLTISKDGSDTIGVGSLVQIRNAAATRSWATQLSASNNLDWWHLNGSWAKYMTLSSTGLAVTGALSATGNVTLGDASTDTLNVGNGGLIKDASGNVGIGVTPSAWVGNRRALEIGGNTVASISYAAGIGESLYNAYVSSTPAYVYKTTAPAGLIDFNNSVSGGFSWKLAPSGTAGDAISFGDPKMTLDASGNFTVNSGSLGYGTGAGGTVTQVTSRTTAVTINKPTGSITMFSAAGSASWSAFTVNNSVVAATDTIVLSVRSGASNVYNLIVSGVAAGSFVINFIGVVGSAVDAPVINFAVIKGVAA